MRRVERSTPSNCRSVDWVDLVAGIRAGDKEAVLRLGIIFQDGIRFFLSRGLGQRQLQSRQREVLSIVIKGIRESSLDHPNRLASHVLAVLHGYVSSKMTASPHLVFDESRMSISDLGAIRELLAMIAAVDKEALRRYYVDNEIASKSTMQ